MRRILLGSLAAALVFWAWSSLRGDSAVAGQDPAQRADLAAMLASAPRTPAMPTVAPAGPDESRTSDRSGGDQVAGAGVGSPASIDPRTASSLDPELERAFASLAQGIEAGDPVARSQALRLLGRDDLPADHRARMRQLLGLEGIKIDDIELVLQRLGENNAFLHCADGLEMGRRALELLRGLDDERSVQMGTILIERCMRGSIERKDKQAIEFVDRAYKQYRTTADRVLCDPASVARSRSYTVAQGDNLAAIAKRFRDEVEGLAIDEGALATLNRIHNMNAIRVGQRIRVPLDPVHAVVEKRSFLMAVYVGERILRLYWVGHGADGKTPVAEFTVAEKLKNPDWDAPDGRRIPFGSPDNILGRHFVKFTHPSYSGFGAHGTPMPETIGTMSSMGCIRMYDDDIEEIFRLLPRKAKIEVRDSH